MKTIHILALLIILPLPSIAQTPASSVGSSPKSAAELAQGAPTAKAEDVKSVDAIVHATYEAISGPPPTRDWKRFRSLFLPEARFTKASKSQDGKDFVVSWNLDDFIARATGIFAKEGFYESALVSVPEQYGNMAEVLSSYESRHAPGEKPIQRGVNSFQLVYDGTRWWVLSITWDSERADNPIPAKLEGKKSGKE
jgi:hypothetical protein